MKKMGLIGLLIISSVYADPGIQEPQNSSKTTCFQSTKASLMHAFATSKQKSSEYAQWAWNKEPEISASIKEKLLTTRRGLALWTATANSWLVEHTPAKVQNWFSSAKKSCNPAWVKTQRILSGWVAHIKSTFN